MNIVIQNGRIIDPANKIDQISSLYIQNGKIFHIGTLSDFSADKIIDARGQWVIPGLVDICCRPQTHYHHSMSVEHEAHAALKRGITTLCIPPDTDPINDNPAHVLRLTQKSDLPMAHLYPIGALTSALAGGSIADLTALHSAGCVAFSNAQHPIYDVRIMRNCYDYAASFNLSIVIQPADPWLSKNGLAHEGEVASRLGLAGIPETAETIAIAQHLLLIEQCGVRAHFTCLSSQHSLKIIREAKAQGLPVSADCAMHMLHLSEMDLWDFDAHCHVYPPLRSVSDRLALINGVQEGVLDAICSDHRPLDTITKLAPFGDTLPGMSTLDTFLALGLALVFQEKLSLTQLIAAITCRPAQIFQLNAGTLTIGTVADVCVQDPTTAWTVAESQLYSQGKNTPFLQWQLKGSVSHTLLAGTIVHEHRS